MDDLLQIAQKSQFKGYLGPPPALQAKTLHYLLYGTQVIILYAKATTVASDQAI